MSPNMLYFVKQSSPLVLVSLQFLSLLLDHGQPEYFTGSSLGDFNFEAEKSDEQGLATGNFSSLACTQNELTDADTDLDPRAPNTVLL